MTKAERIFKDTRYECYRSVKTWGFEEVVFNNVADRHHERICTRTLNDLDKIYNRKVKELMTDYQLGIMDKEKAKFEAQVLRKVRLTLDNARQSLNK